MKHEQLEGVPPICEVCYCPISGRIFHVTFLWPGAGGRAVYVHTGDCYMTVVRRMRQRHLKGMG